MKIVFYIITALVQLVVAVSGFFFLLLGLNGFSEPDATPSLIVYVVVSGLTVFGDGALGLFIGSLLSRRMGAGSAYVVGNVLAVLLGVVVLIATLFGCFLLASMVHDARIAR